MAQVMKPLVPYKGPIYEGIHEGKQIKITGHVPHGADKFTVNLMNGLDTKSDNRPLHISVRFKINTVIRNVYRNKTWEKEERDGCFPFTKGKDFTMVILVEKNAYQIFVNGQHCWNFYHRIPFIQARSIYINGDVSVEQIEFINKATTPQVICPPTAPLDTYGDFLDSGDLPCIFPIHGGIRPGLSIYITGQPTYNPNRFTISIQKGAFKFPSPDVAFHFDVRFYDYSIIRNSRLNDVWYSEEAAISHFPFHPGGNFEVIIKVESDMYVVMVNGQHFISFRHRMNAFAPFNIVSIQKDVIVTSVRCT